MMTIIKRTKKTHRPKAIATAPNDANCFISVYVNGANKDKKVCRVNFFEPAGAGAYEVELTAEWIKKAYEACYGKQG